MDVLLRAADAGDTFLYWVWLRPPYEAQVARRPAQALDGALRDLNRAIPVAQIGGQHGPAAGAEPGAPRVDAWTAGPFSDPHAERDFAETLTAAVFPEKLGAELVDAAATGNVRLRVTPSPRLARVPWELLLAPDGRRLLELCEIVFEPPSTIFAERSRHPPSSWREVRHLPVLHVIDPELDAGDDRTLTPDGANAFKERLARLQGTGRALGFGEQQNAPQANIDRYQLNLALHEDRSRLLYFGHVSAAADKPGTASLHLSDPARTWGLAPQDGGNRPLSALDLLLGTTRCDDPNVWADYDSDRRQYGHEIWPMPSRVAIIACEGGVDFRSSETFGLVMAMLDSGADLVTTTRWPLPSDHAFHTAFGDRGIAETDIATTDLALTVDDAHEVDDPIATLRAWQREQWQNWQKTKDIRYSPILWAALTHTCAPRRDTA